MNATSTETAPAVVETLDSPATLPDGRVIDLTVSEDAPDPYIDPCPSWCELDHQIVMDESERYHTGREIIIPLRYERAEYFSEGRTFTLGHLRLYWRREPGARDARLVVAKGERDDGADLTPDEAKQLRDALDALLSDAAE